MTDTGIQRIIVETAVAESSDLGAGCGGACGRLLRAICGCFARYREERQAWLEYRIISSDDHVFEPPDLWTSRIEARYRDRAPRMFHRDEDNTDWWICDGVKGSGSGTGGGSVGARFEDPEKLAFAASFEGVRPGGYIPEDHIKDMDIDGIDVSIMYPTQGLLLYSVKDGELLNAVFATYNNWIAEFCSAYPSRLRGVAMLNIDDVQLGVREMERCAKLGLVGTMISVYPTEDRAYDSPEYEPLWAAAQDLRMPLSLHLGTNRAGPNDAFVDTEGDRGRLLHQRGSLGANVPLPHDLQRCFRALPQAAGGVHRDGAFLGPPLPGQAGLQLHPAAQDGEVAHLQRRHDAQ